MESSQPEKPKDTKAYDKILKENFRTILLPVVAKLAGIEMLECTPLPEEINMTINRNVDFLMEVLDMQHNHFILHVEFQTESEADMVYRVGEYHGFLQKQYKLEIRHFVVYLGKGKTRMTTTLPDAFQFKGYQLIQLSQIPLEEFIESEIPEEIVLAILSKFPKAKLPAIIRLILQRLKKVCKNQIELEKFLHQLTILSQIRKFDQQTKKIINEMPITLDLTKNAFFKDALKDAVKQGLKQGLEQGLEQGIEQGLEQGLVQGIEQGIEQGLEQGIEQERLVSQKRLEQERLEAQQRHEQFIRMSVKNMLLLGFAPEGIAGILNLEPEKVLEICAQLREEESTEK
jgi:predicted transposase YdaD